jgi:1-deoxy-D-xylulose-5-phosphate synthase
MSISPNVGALAKSFAPLHQGQPASDSGALFSALGVSYCGPIDGHDIGLLVQTLRELVAQKGPRLLHVITRKGKGYPQAETDPVKYHGVSGFDPEAGITPKPASAKKPPTYTEVFGDWLCDMAAADPQVVAITPAMREGSGLVNFARQYPQRYFDAGIAEQHAVTLGAGLACEGFKPVVAIYSTFLQRAYDQLIHDVALQNLPVLFALDRGGLAGADGATHHGSFDLSFLRCIPNMTIMTPADENECRQMLYTGINLDGPAAVRYPRGCGPGVAVDPDLQMLPVGQAEMRRHGRKIAFLAFGCMLDLALEVAEQLDASVVNMRFVKPLDENLLQQMAASHDLLITLEDNVVCGGAGSAVNECLMAQQMLTPVLNLGLPDRFVGHGSREQLLAGCGLDCEGVLAAIAGYHRNVLPLRRQRA